MFESKNDSMDYEWINEVKDTKVLFLPVGFYEYDDEITKTMEEMGMIVTTFCPRINLGIIGRMIDRATKRKYEKQKNTKHQKQFVEKIQSEGIEYDYVFVIVGNSLNVDVFKKIKLLNKKAKFILYMWDDVARVPNFYMIKDFFDVIYTFDHNDSKQYNLIFRPLFYTHYYCYDKNLAKKYDLSLVGWLHSDRLIILEKIINICKLKGMKLKGYLYTGIPNYYLDKFHNKDFRKKPEFIHFKTISMQDSAQIMKESKIVIDVQHPSQCGLTMRTIETIGAQTKLITTNVNVKLYDFYNPNNILVIDRENPCIPDEFLEMQFEPLVDKILDRYSIKSWVKEMFLFKYNKYEYLI